MSYGSGPAYKSSAEAADILVANKEGYTLIRDRNVALSETSGYLVGGAARGDELVFLPGTDEAVMRAAIARWIDRQPRFDNNRPQYIGIWTDSATGKIHLDVSDWIEPLFEAEAIGVLRRQIAIWDCRNGKEIRL